MALDHLLVANKYNGHSLALGGAKEINRATD
jgi:hypothetical protein